MISFEDMFQAVYELQQKENAAIGRSEGVRTVSQEELRRLEIRRVGVLCLVARENGWKVRGEADDRRKLVRLSWVSPTGKVFEGSGWARPREAVRQAAERIEKLI